RSAGRRLHTGPALPGRGRGSQRSCWRSPSWARSRAATASPSPATASPPMSLAWSRTPCSTGAGPSRRSWRRSPCCPATCCFGACRRAPGSATPHTSPPARRWPACCTRGSGAPSARTPSALTTATVGSLSVMRRAVRADELQLVQGLSQAIAADINLARSFGRIQELTRRLVPWEQMGFARYDAQTNEMALIADTALPAGERSGERFAADVGLTGEAVRLGRPVVARKPRGEPAVPPGHERPGSEVLVPLYHAGQLVGLWSVRHSDPAI